MLHTFTVVGVDDVDQAVLGLDDGGVAVFTEVALPNDVLGMRSNFVFESEDGFPRVAVLGHSEVENATRFEDGAALWSHGAFAVVIDNKLSAIFERECVGARCD